MNATSGPRAVTKAPVTSIGTFLMTDIEGSTRLWEEHPESMPAALAAHDAILRAAVETHGGVVIRRRAMDSWRGSRNPPWPSTSRSRRNVISRG